MEKIKSRVFCDDNGEDEGYPGYGKKMSLDKANKLAKSLCKITIEENVKNDKKLYGTGFFMNLKYEGKDLKCLITNYHVITQNLVDEKKDITIQVEKRNEITIKLDVNKRFIKCFSKPTDISMIEIIDEDHIKEKISFLWYDFNYSLGYNNYLESDIIILQHPLGKEVHLGIGKILKITNFEFEHTIDTEYGSSGSPVILMSNNLVIGIHKQSNKRNKNGIGTFIGEIFNNNEHKNDENDNYSNLFKKECSICHIYYESITDNEICLKKGLGFFCKIEDIKIPIKKALITSNTILSEQYINKNPIIKIKYLNNIKEIPINKNRLYFTNNELNYTLIEIFESDGIEDFFEIDRIIFKESKSLENEEIIILEYGEKLSFCSGKIKYHKNNQLIYTTSLKNDPLGSPIIRKSNTMVLGIHINNENNEYIVGLPFGTILNDLKRQLEEEKKINKLIIANVEITKNKNLTSITINSYENNENNNIIFGNIRIEKDNTTSLIINSFENSKNGPLSSQLMLFSTKFEGINNEDEIKDCDIYINGQKIDFHYYVNFPKAGDYKIQYIFHKQFKSTNFMFYNCTNITYLDFTHFNTVNIEDMSFMFHLCANLKSVNLSNFITEKVKSMTMMFCLCLSLKSIDLSNFNTKNVTNMSFMFMACKSLENINLSNFTGESIKNMTMMFEECESLKYINLTNFNTNGKNVITGSMFYECYSLTKENIITQDEAILKELMKEIEYNKKYR